MVYIKLTALQENGRILRIGVGTYLTSIIGTMVLGAVGYLMVGTCMEIGLNDRTN